jgi:DNA-binding NarL/FixJ family response regulator
MKAALKINAGVVSADPMRALGMTTILEDWFGLDAAAFAFEELGKDRKLSLLLMDVYCCGTKLTDVIARLRSERAELKIIVIGALLDFDFIQEVIGAGARGYLLETSDEREVRMAIEVVLDGSVWAPRKVLARLLDRKMRGGNAGGSEESIQAMMTPREQQVMQQLLEGSSNRQIAQVMGIDEVTVKAHLGRMLRKTGTSNRIELTLRALEESSPETGSTPALKDLN